MPGIKGLGRHNIYSGDGLSSEIGLAEEVAGLAVGNTNSFLGAFSTAFSIFSASIVLFPDGISGWVLVFPVSTTSRIRGIIMALAPIIERISFVCLFIICQLSIVNSQLLLRDVSFRI